jgi:predicted AAA+ superfamily ATPase
MMEEMSQTRQLFQYDGRTTTTGVPMARTEHEARNANPVLVRQQYLERIRPFYELTDLVKVLTGIRRCGKSVILSQVADEIRALHPDATLVSINFELSDFGGLHTATLLEEYVLARVGAQGGGRAYVFLDEPQVVEGFELAVNSLRARGNISLFISGSNASMFSEELATHLAGRYVEFRIWPLSYAESLELRGLRPTTETLEDYLRWGGLPLRFALQGTSERRAYLDDVFNSVVLRDVVQRKGIRDVGLLQTLVSFALENLGRTMSPSSITKYLAGQGRKVGTDTLYSYLDAMTDALLFNRVRRYDLRGKQVLTSLDKFYATDLGVLASKRVGSGPGIGDVIENVVFCALAARGFEVFTGVGTSSEVDFVAVKDSQPRYLQVTYLLASPEVERREFGALEAIADNYPKFVVSLDPLPQSRNGIIHLGLEELLLHPPRELA